MKRIICIALSVFLVDAIAVSAQSDTAQYTKDFNFKEGIYLTYADFRANNPIPKSKIVSNYDKNALDFYKQELNKVELKYSDSANTQKTVKTSKLWGYCSNNNVYINYGKEFSKIMVIGSICHFTAYIEVYLGGYDHYNNTPTTMRSGYELEQFVIDFKSGKVGAFNVVNMEALLKQDEALYAEFMALKKKKKRDLSFFYLRKFNEKHPVYFGN